MSASGIDETGRWSPAFEGQRPPFEPGHDLSVGNRGLLRHGAYATLRLRGRAREIADVLAQERPDVSALVLEVAATTLARIEAAQAALDEVDEASAAAISSYLPSRAAGGGGGLPYERLRQDLRGWTNTAIRLFNELGMTPMSTARIAESLADRSTKVQVNVAALVASPEWNELRGRLLRALEAHPDAMRDVMRAIGDGSA